MSRVAAVTALVAVVLASGVRAQENQGRGTTPPAAEKPAAQRPANEPLGQPVNVRLEFTITDQGGAGEPAKKTVSMIVADRSAGSIRSMGNNVRATLNVDATPQIMANGAIKVQVGLEYNPRQINTTQEKVKAGNGEVLEVGPREGGSALSQRVAILLMPGKPLVLSQAADPLSDRRITVEVRAEILK